jgi:UDP-N-acetylmuramoylalanine--D-glutamate ligase
LKIDKNHSVAILGSGESGMGALRLAKKFEMNTFLSDAKPIAKENQAEMHQLGSAFEENGHSLEKLLMYDLIVKSPGIPDTAQIILSLKEAGKPVISEIEFAYHFTDAKIVGITGSNGKTTTTLLTTHLLKCAGLNVASAGNLGNSFSDLLVNDTPDIIVLELSSFQLDGIVDFKPDIAILLNITPDHLDRYGYDLEKYADAKIGLVQNMDSDGTFIYNMDDTLISRKIADSDKEPIKIKFSIKEKTSNGAYFLEHCLVFENNKGIQIIPTDDLALVGKHNLYNQMAAVIAVESLGVSFDQSMQGLQSFINAPHRLEWVATVNGVQYLNDSKATNVDAVYYALDAMTQPLVWIAGGINKGNDYSQIKTLVKNKVKALICIGKDNTHLTTEFSEDVDVIIETSSIEEALDRASELANEEDVVLLSPACSSFDRFDSYEQRGDFFRNEVMKLKEKEIVKI